MVNTDNLPEEYQLMKIGNVILSITNGTTSAQNKENKGYMVTRIETIANGEIDLERTNFVELDKEKYDKFKLKEGDILFSHINSTKHIGKTAIYHSEMGTLIHGMNLLRLVPNKEIILPEFLLYLLKDKKTLAFYQTRCKRAVNQSSLDQKTIKKFEFIIPPLKTQQKIVEIIEKAEKLREWRAEADVLTDEYLKSVFLEMFGDTGLNEKNWEIVKFKGIAKIDKKSVQPDKINDDDCYIGLEHIESNTGEILEVLNAKETKLKSNKFAFDDKCLLYGKLRPYLNKVALPNFKGVCSTDILPIRPIKGKSNKYFLTFLLKNDYFVEKATEMSTGANLPRISPKIIENFDVYAPSLELQNQFAEIVQRVEQLKAEQKQSKQEIDNLFNALMQKAFKGELTC